jgi:hypothetical protein
MSAAKNTTKKSTGGRTTPKKTVTDGAEWAREGRANVSGKPLTVPSGKTCLVRRPDGMKFFLDQGMIPNALLPMVMEAVNEHKETSPKELGDAVMESPDMLPALLDLADRVVVHCVVEPKVEPVPKDEEGNVVPPEERPDDDTLYIDYIDQEDKMFIFNYAVSGVTDVAEFRRESAKSVADLQSSQAVQ